MRVIRLAAPLILVGLLLAGCASRNEPRPVPNPDSSQYDREFLRWLVVYHEDQDRKLQPCAAKRSIRKELRDFCIQADQQHEERVGRLREWLKSWYGEERPKGDPFPLWLATLEGERFEREFLKAYPERHAEGIEETRTCSARATHQELRELCARINTAQQKTADRLRRWKCSWYQECSGKD